MRNTEIHTDVEIYISIHTYDVEKTLIKIEILKIDKEI